MMCGICEHFDECFGERMPSNCFVEYGEYASQPEVTCKKQNKIDWNNVDWGDLA